MQEPIVLDDDEVYVIYCWLRDVLTIRPQRLGYFDSHTMAFGLTLRYRCPEEVDPVEYYQPIREELEDLGIEVQHVFPGEAIFVVLQVIPRLLEQAKEHQLTKQSSPPTMLEN